MKTFTFATVERPGRARVHKSDVGLGLAAVAIAPLLAVAFLWAALLLLLGGTWLLHILGLA